MESKGKVESILFVECPRLKIALRLHRQTWEEHIKPFHPLQDKHLPIIEDIIKSANENQPIWYKENNPERMCIVRQTAVFLPHNKFILIAFRRYSKTTGCITSIYPVDELPAKEKGYKS